VGRRIKAFWVLVTALFVSAPALAAFDAAFDGAPFEVTADILEYERARDVYVARGNVRLVQEGKTLSADWISFSRRGGRGVASGNVIFSNGADTIFSSFVEFNITTLQGVLLMAHFDDSENRFRMEGEEIVKTGDRTYTFERGRFTTCRCPDGDEDPWQIRAASADLEVEGYAVARNTTINILGVPIIWMPWMFYPVKTERDSGFLLPEFAYRDRTGFDIGLPFFWAAAPNVNVTLTPHWLSKRGVKGDVEAEYLIGEHSSGAVFASFIRDDDVDANSLENPYDRERWIAKGRQDFYLPHGWRFKSEFQLVSDNAYPSDFRDLPETRHDRFLTSNVSATKHFNESGDYGFVASALYADDRQNPDDQDRDDYLLHRLPNAEYTMLPQRAPWLEQLVPSFDTEYTYFAQFENPNKSFAATNDVSRQRKNGCGGFGVVNIPTLSADGLFYDVGIDALANAQEKTLTAGEVDPHGDDYCAFNGTGSEGNGLFDEGEPLADRGHRVKLNPRLALPGRLGDYLEVYPEVGYRQTFYDSREKGSESWGMLTGRVDLRSRLQRSLGMGVVHIMEPRLGYAVVTAPNFRDEPVFTPRTAVPQTRIRQLDLDNVTRDGADRLEDFNGITWGISNRFYRRATADQGPRLLADFIILSQYDFSNGGQFGNIIADGMARLGDATELRFNAGFDLDESTLEEVLTEAVWRGQRMALRARYRYLKNIPKFFENFLEANERYEDFRNNFDRINQVSGTVAYRLGANWLVRYQGGYSFERSFSLTHRGAIEYVSQCDCWAVGVEARKNRDTGVEFNLVYRIVGLGKGKAASRGSGLAQFSFLDGI
jgi:lipopolysaccharide assembly outer membrane protein LptD (OstA)